MAENKKVFHHVACYQFAHAVKKQEWHNDREGARSAGDIVRASHLKARRGVQLERQLNGFIQVGFDSFRNYSALREMRGCTPYDLWSDNAEWSAQMEARVRDSQERHVCANRQRGLPVRAQLLLWGFSHLLSNAAVD